MTTPEIRNPSEPSGVSVPMQPTTMSHSPPGTVPSAVVPIVEANDSFSAFYRHAWPQVARGLGATLGDVNLAAEATDEAMARAYAHWSKVGAYEFPAGWVYRVGLNWSRSYHRRMARALPNRRLDTGELGAVAEPSVRAALLDLDVKHRSVIVCRLLLDWSVEETATALKIAPGTVKSRQSRALDILASTLGHLR